MRIHAIVVLLLSANSDRLPERYDSVKNVYPSRGRELENSLDAAFKSPETWTRAESRLHQRSTLENKHIRSKFIEIQPVTTIEELSHWRDMEIQRC